MAERKKEIRCAIYTRKSTDEGLDREFNSLDAQRESAEAFIISQVHEGWVLLPERYDDGGYTGGNMDRPALKRLLQDVAEGRVDCIVVYKVDRLSRSLMDFAKIIGMLENHHATFVSVTQQFNSTTSMGRLTLNILLSFAQFEREIISERTRDKMSAARRKGKWVGGMPILGYDVDSTRSRLIVNEDEASRVREIFNLYLSERGLLPVVQELARRGWGNKRWTTKKGIERGGSPFDKVTLYRCLTNFLYIGKVEYKGELYKGEHQGIVDEDVFIKVRTMLRENRRNGGAEVRNRYGALLKGLLYCGSCKTTMIHYYTTHRNRRYRYYVCAKAQKNGWDTCPVKSLPAGDIERFVLDTMRNIGKDDALAQAVLRQAQEQYQQCADSLQREQNMIEKELAHLDYEIKKLVKTMGYDSDAMSTTRLADLQDMMRQSELRAAEVREELRRRENELLDMEKMSRALSLFDPLWDAMMPKERLRVVQLLVERVVYDGVNGKVSVSFHPSGLNDKAFESVSTPTHKK